MISGGNVYDIDYANSSLVATPGLLPHELSLEGYSLSDYSTGMTVV